MMGMSLVPRLLILCPLCKTNAADSEEHEPTCPKARIAAAVRSNQIWDCNRCGGKIELTLDDYLECRKCRRIYTTGMVAMGHNPDTLPEEHLRQISPVEKTDTYTKVLTLPVRGKQRRFRLDDTLRKIRADIPDWKRRHR